MSKNGGADVQSNSDADFVFLEIYEMFVEMVHQASAYLDVFEKYNTRMEGWFHGQLVKTIGVDPRPGWKLLEVGKKVGNDEGRPDLWIKCGEQELAIEIKSMVIDTRTLKMYFRKSFGKDLRKLNASSGPMCLLTVAFPVSDESKWTELKESAASEFSVYPLAERDLRYGEDRTARVTLWEKKE